MIDQKVKMIMVVGNIVKRMMLLVIQAQVIFFRQVIFLIYGNLRVGLVLLKARILQMRKPAR